MLRCLENELALRGLTPIFRHRNTFRSTAQIFPGQQWANAGVHGGFVGRTQAQKIKMDPDFRRDDSKRPEAFYRDRALAAASAAAGESRCSVRILYADVDQALPMLHCQIDQLRVKLFPALLLDVLSNLLIRPGLFVATTTAQSIEYVG